MTQAVQTPSIRPTAWDVALVLQDVRTGRYHAAHFTVAPMPGPTQPEGFLRLKSRMHHTAGHESFEESVQELRKLANTLDVPEEDTLTTGAVEWDGEVGIVLLLPTR